MRKEGRLGQTREEAAGWSTMLLAEMLGNAGMRMTDDVSLST